MTNVPSLSGLCNQMPADDFDFWDLFLDSLNDVIGEFFGGQPFLKRTWIVSLQQLADALDEAGIPDAKQEVASAVVRWLGSGRAAKARSIPAVMSTVLPKMMKAA